MGLRFCFGSTTAFTFHTLKLSAPLMHAVAATLFRNPILVSPNAAAHFSSAAKAISSSSTAEIPLGGIHVDSILADSQLPCKYYLCWLSFAPIYTHLHPPVSKQTLRTEAGAAGTASKGLFRVHQFKKVEMFILCRPEESESYHEELISIEEDIFSSIRLHFKTMDMASGDLGAPAYRKFDIEAWIPGLGRYGEISSVSNCTDYQSRRLGIRYCPSELPLVSTQKGKGSFVTTQFVHTLNATACAAPRMIICVLENFQQEDGSVIIPEPLRPYMGGLERMGPKPS